MLTRNASWPGPRHGARTTASTAKPATGILLEIETFQRRHAMSAGGFAKRMRLGGDWLSKVRAGATPRPETLARLRAAMAAYDREAGR